MRSLMIWDSEVFTGGLWIMIWDSGVFIEGSRTMIWDSEGFPGGSIVMIWISCNRGPGSWPISSGSSKVILLEAKRNKLVF